MTKLAIAGLLALGLAEPALAAGKKKKSQDDGVRAMSVTIDRNGTVIILSSLAISDSRVDICGVYFFEEGGSASSRVQVNQVLNKVYFKLDGRALLASASAFTRYDNLADAKKNPKFGCARTNRKPGDVRDPASFEMKLAPGYIME